jgi:preprotein translocase subunit Sss1
MTAALIGGVLGAVICRRIFFDADQRTKQDYLQAIAITLILVFVLGAFGYWE